MSDKEIPLRRDARQLCNQGCRALNHLLSSPTPPIPPPARVGWSYQWRCPAGRHAVNLMNLAAVLQQLPLQDCCGVHLPEKGRHSRASVRLAYKVEENKAFVSLLALPATIKAVPVSSNVTNKSSKPAI